MSSTPFPLACKEDGSILEMDVETGASTVTRPLFVVNGKITEAEEVRSINPKSIERMEVMKDKAAIEKYGDKAKDGVILITLKKN